MFPVWNLITRLQLKAKAKKCVAITQPAIRNLKFPLMSLDIYILDTIWNLNLLNQANIQILCIHALMQPAVSPLCFLFHFVKITLLVSIHTYHTTSRHLTKSSACRNPSSTGDLGWRQNSVSRLLLVISLALAQSAPQIFCPSVAIMAAKKLCLPPDHALPFTPSSSPPPPLSRS